jgi:general nucleoside transport system permease protein
MTGSGTPAGPALDPAPGAPGPVSSWRGRLVSSVVGSSVWARVAAVVLALIVAIPAILAAGADPGEAYTAMFDGSLGSGRALGDVLNRADTFVLLGLGIAISIRAGFFNVGAEGQLWLGALGATVVTLYLDASGPVVVTLALVAGFVFGALWSGLVALLKIFLRVEELIGSLMLNYIAILFIGWLTFGPMKAYRAGQTERIGADKDLPVPFAPDSRLHIGFLLTLLAVGGVWLLLTRTTFGYEIRTLGSNPEAARFAGIRINWLVARVSLLGGGLCGLAGANAVLGVQHVLLSNFSPGWGYTAIAVALLGGLMPFGVLFAGILFGALEIGATNMQYAAGVPTSVGGLIEGLILIVFLLSIPFTLSRRRWADRLDVLRAKRRARAEG